MKKILVWTKGYRPFMLGGCVNADVGAWLEPGPEISIRGVKFVTIKAPNGETGLVEPRSGALMGFDFKMVEGDIAATTKKYINKQIIDAIERKKKVDVISADSFWRMLHKDGGAK